MGLFEAYQAIVHRELDQLSKDCLSRFKQRRGKEEHVASRESPAPRAWRAGEEMDAMVGKVGKLKRVDCIERARTERA